MMPDLKVIVAGGIALPLEPFIGRHLIGGAWAASQGRATFERVSPAHGAVVSRLARGGAAEAEVTIAAARETLERGKPILQARGEVSGAADRWRHAASLAQPAGADTFATMTLSGRDVVARMRADASVAPEHMFDFAIDMEKAVACDPLTEARITA